MARIHHQINEEYKTTGILGLILSNPHSPCVDFNEQRRVNTECTSIKLQCQEKKCSKNDQHPYLQTSCDNFVCWGSCIPIINKGHGYARSDGSCHLKIESDEKRTPNLEMGKMFINKTQHNMQSHKYNEKIKFMIMKKKAISYLNYLQDSIIKGIAFIED